MRESPADQRSPERVLITATHAVTAATVDDMTVDKASGQTSAGTSSGWGFVFHAVPPEGVEVTLEVRG
jgi:hypothetical protein